MDQELYNKKVKQAEFLETLNSFFDNNPAVVDKIADYFISKGKFN